MHYKYGHTASVCHFLFDENYQPNSSLVLRDPTSQNYKPQNQYNSASGQSSADPNSGLYYGDSRPSNVWTNNNYKSANSGSNPNPSALLTKVPNHDFHK